MLKFGVVSLFIILSLSMISANYLVAGTVYNGNPGNPVAGAVVTITCDSNVLTTTSLSDGAYAVVFGVNSCSTVNVNADGHDASVIKMYVDPYATDTSHDGGGSSGGSGGTFFLCGNNVCDVGETQRTCQKTALQR